MHQQLHESRGERRGGQGGGRGGAGGCSGCGDCIACCPSGGMGEKSRGYRLFAGGKFGRMPFLGKKILGVLGTKEEALAAISAVLEFFRAPGKPRERFGDTLQRTGFPALETYVKETPGW